MPVDTSNTFTIRTATTLQPAATHSLPASLTLAFDPSLGNEDVVVDSPSAVRLGVSWRALEARFGPHPLTRHFIDRLLESKPACVAADELNTATVELLRCAHALGMNIRFPEPVADCDAESLRWTARLTQQAARSTAKDSAAIDWDYGLYSLGMRNHDLLQRMNRPLLTHLKDRRRVLDIGCGCGILLDLLARAGIQAQGVERDAVCARYALSLGLDVLQADALAYVSQCAEQFDGLVCSHFVEHLDIESLKALLFGISRVLQPGGIAVLVFPDPESIRSQLLGFWRDPEHVRFYHPDLVAALARVHGLICDFNSLHHDGRVVGPFSFQPPPAQRDPTPSRRNWLAACARTLGLATQQDIAHLQRTISHQRGLINQLWQVNQTWAWSDNAVLRLRKAAA